MADTDGLYPGQTWSARYQTGVSVRVTLVDDRRVGFTPDLGATVKYLARRKFVTAYRKSSR